MLKIVTGPNTPVLRTPAQPVNKITKETKKIIKEMEQVMHNLKGIGIAAPQVGIPQRIFLAILGLDTPSERLTVFINPEITYFSEETDIKEEGCLSLPKTFGNVQRSTNITVTYQNIQGQQQTINLSDMDARVVQHETDHLNGILFIDRIV